VNGSEGREAPRFLPRRDDATLLAAVALLALLGFAWAIQNYGREHEPHVVVARVREIEAQIRTHSPGLRLLVEGRDVPEPNDPARESRHQPILRDFERLARLDGFELTDVHAEVVGDRARVSYRIRGVSRVAGEPVPSAGEMVFTRDGSEWRLVEQRLFERR
jgi:hypothetical protein